MVNVAIKKKIHSHLKSKLKSKMIFDIDKLKKSNKNFNKKNIFSSIIIHYYCLKKNIKSQVDKNNKLPFMIMIKKSCKKFTRYNDHGYFLSCFDIYLNLLIEYYISCMKNSLIDIFLPTHRFIKKVKIAESLVKLK